MLHKLESHDYSKVTPIFKELNHQIVIGSIIEGNTVGEIYVDNLESPAFAVVWDKMDAILVEGEFDNEHMNSGWRQLSW